MYCSRAKVMTEKAHVMADLSAIFLHSSLFCVVWCVTLNIPCTPVSHLPHPQMVIYHGANHFTAHIVMATGLVWFHDGMVTGNFMEYECMLVNCTICRKKCAIAVMYVLEWLEVNKKRDQDLVLPCRVVALWLKYLFMPYPTVSHTTIVLTSDPWC